MHPERGLVLVVAVGLTLVTASVHSGSSTSMPADVGPGRIAWFDIITTDLTRSKQFGGGTLG